jgi:CBS domain-containing protein
VCSLRVLALQVNRLPVVGTRGKVVGVVTRHDLLKGLYIASPLL